MLHKSSRRLYVTSLVLVAACGGGGGPGNNNNAGNMSASIDGAGWSATSATSSANAGGIFTITGVQVGSGTSVTMTLYSIGAPGTFPLGVGSTVAGGLASVVSGTSGWSTPLSGDAGSVTVTSVSPTRIVGSFTFTAAAVTPPGSTGNRVVTQGRFDVPVTGPATLAVPDNAGGKVSGTFAGVSFNASSVASVSAPASGVLTFAGANTGQTLSVIVSGYTGVGTYALGGGVSRSIRLTNTIAPAGTWGGTNATTTGTVTVTSVTTTRIKGTFTATLQPVVGGGSAVAVSGTFDLGI